MGGGGGGGGGEQGEGGGRRGDKKEEGEGMKGERMRGARHFLLVYSLSTAMFFHKSLPCFSAKLSSAPLYLCKLHMHELTEVLRVLFSWNLLVLELLFVPR